MRRLLAALALVAAVAMVSAVGVDGARRRRSSAPAGAARRLDPSLGRPVSRATHDPAIAARAAEGVSLLQLYAETHLHSGSALERATAEHYGLDVKTFRAAHAELLEQKSKSVGKGKGKGKDAGKGKGKGKGKSRTHEGDATCSGLVPSLCPGRADVDGGPGDWADSIAEECGEMFCSPMCMRNTWSCSVDFGDLEAESDDPSFGKALCGQFFAEGCTNILGCCPNDEKMMDYVQDHQFGDKFPTPALPTPSCEHDAKDSKVEGDLCGKCSGAVEVELEALDCPFPVVDPEEDDSFLQIGAGVASEAELLDRAAVDSMSATELLTEIAHLRKQMNLPRRALAPHQTILGGAVTTRSALSADASEGMMTADGDESAFVEIDTRATGALEARAGAGVRDPWDAGPAKFKSLKYRCDKLKAVVEGAIGGMTSAFKAKACSCMGCCKGECFFHVKERMEE